MKPNEARTWPKYSERDVRHAIKKYFDPVAYITPRKVRWTLEERCFGRKVVEADAISLLPGDDGPEMHGFEIKCSRSDWYTELSKPGKWRPVGRFCDYWWLLASNPDIAKISEIPKDWGYMCIDTPGIMVMKKAPRLEPDPWSQRFVQKILDDAAHADSAHRYQVQRENPQTPEESVRYLESKKSKSYSEIERAHDLTKLVIPTSSGWAVGGVRR